MFQTTYQTRGDDPLVLVFAATTTNYDLIPVAQVGTSAVLDFCMDDVMSADYLALVDVLARDYSAVMGTELVAVNQALNSK